MLRLVTSKALVARSCNVLQTATYHGRARIGNREVVGFGWNGEYIYTDRPDYPMPSIRYKENTPEVLALREKEKGDWKKLTVDEKKALYRASFCQTFAEFKAPNGDWKHIVAGCLVGVALSFWYYIWMKKYVYGPMPDSFLPENKEAQLKRMIALRVNRIEGLTSNWDYEKGQWKE